MAAGERNLGTSYKQHYDRLRLRVVKRGVPLLTREVPGWRERLRVGDLDLEEHRICVVGQLFPDYRTGLRMLSGLVRPGELYVWSVKHGFDVYEEEPYRVLSRVWYNELKGTRTGT